MKRMKHHKALLAAALCVVVGLMAMAPVASARTATAGRNQLLSGLAASIFREAGLSQDQANDIASLLNRKNLSDQHLLEAWNLGQSLTRYSGVVGQYFWSLMRYYAQQPGFSAGDLGHFIRWAKTPDFISAISRGREGRFAVSPRHHQMWAEMQRFWGAPYRWGGENPSGTDCSGFTLKTFLRAGIDLPRTAREQFKQGIPLRTEDLAPGDLVFFSPRGGGITHVGIYLGGNRFAHSASSKGVAYSFLQGDKYWGPAYRGARRMF